MRRRRRMTALALAGLLVLLAWAQLHRPIPLPQGQLLLPTARAYTAPLRPPWPSGGEAAIGAQGLGLWGASGSLEHPIASLTKVMTALTALELKPLAPGQTGPTWTVSAADAAAYQSEAAQGQSVVQVVAGEQLSEEQLLEGMLIPSGNNFALMLAEQAAGSEAQLVTDMNRRAARMGLRHSHFADVSGASDHTVSAPADLVSLGEAAMAEPVIAGIVALPQVQLPLAGMVYNVNYVLGQDGIVGVKTGSSPGAGACYLFAAPVRLASGRSLYLVGAIQDLPTLALAFSAAERLLDAARSDLQVLRVVARGQTVGRLQAAWGPSTPLRAVEELDLALWPGEKVQMRLISGPLPLPLGVGQARSELGITAGAQDLRLPLSNSQALPAPSRTWRLLRIT
ncbi:MAG TPA: hypothetical protein VNI34_10750 [Candidatus Nitrosotalea sp.]|nr:hypothetical protein [Candidatus Nitrosotalea sp.]